MTLRIMGTTLSGTGRWMCRYMYPILVLRLACEATGALVDYVVAADPDPKARPEDAADAMAMTIVRIIAEARSAVGGGK